MGIFDGKKTVKGPMGGPIARIEDGTLRPIGGGGSILSERDGRIGPISGFPTLRVKENPDGSKSITDNGGQVMFRVSADGKDVFDVHGHKLFKLE